MREHSKRQGLTAWQIGEFIIGALALTYFLVYPRAALSDFVVCTILCLLVYRSSEELGLYKADLQSWGRADYMLLALTFGLFSAAWFYGFSKDKLSLNTALASLAITLTYFYYAIIQHFLAQRYLAARMMQVSKEHKPKAALFTGLVFGVLHIPFPHLIIPSTIGGMLFAYYYLSTGRLWMVVFAHALISSTLIFWFFGKNPFISILELFA
ncbi:MAG: CPBP family intramembrane metalloprotease [Aureispira sp.]|nr:CPBP family intramembrane metalloprotease [Aureispira sp.]